MKLLAMSLIAMVVLVMALWYLQNTNVVSPSTCVSTGAGQVCSSVTTVKGQGQGR